MTSTPEVKTDRAADCEIHCVHPDAVARVEAQLPDDALIERATNLTKVVSDPTRLRILSALALEELCVCDLAVIAGINESTMSHQLRYLRALDLVTFKKVGRIAYYRLASTHVTRLIADMLEHARTM
ncbi:MULTISPECIES: helix-turn-helix transcriptional regulator [unclassified Deinococcus]|uniref:ArsR/SmtB family transcription factor n=1 Tax=unclassified Deinococcus TaxID=2623546 RepID=UPI0006DCE20B|nr:MULTISPECIES: metalloregulator ArsR/SmtB family transcription factor [unclassified Deinococcus]MCD0168122.1 helix-turn-helix transcriptional regulator [Deinococcus sp. 23YEL01]PIG95565.1 transcriptional regulator [Deinococcus sp. UR1]